MGKSIFFFTIVVLVIFIASLFIIGSEYKEVRNDLKNPSLKRQSYPLLRPSLVSIAKLELIQFDNINDIKIINKAGNHLSQCDGYNLPEGITVRVSEDNTSCKLIGVPMELQQARVADVIAINEKGCALSRVVITVNASSY